jgi:TonB family protein
MNSVQKLTFFILVLAVPQLVLLQAHSKADAQAEPTSSDAKLGELLSGEPVSKIDPKYPPKALKENLQGTVILQGSIGKDGRIDTLWTLSGDPVLAKAAVDAISRWRYEPYKPAAEALGTQVNATVNFAVAADGGHIQTEVRRTLIPSSPNSSPTNRRQFLRGEVFRLGPGLTPPQVISPPRNLPSYVREQEGKNQGTCELELVVDTDGAPYNIRVLHPVGRGLDEKAVETVNSWRFKPATKDGRPVAALITIVINFHLF